MHRIDGAGATETGQWTEGNPSTGTPATEITEDWMNAIQNEVENVIVTGAGITLNKASNSQLLLAIQTLIASAVGSTGDIKLTLKTAADAGWLMCNDGTIGSASSGATTRANADTSALYTLLWTNVSNTYAPVTGGRGGSAAADFAANKPIALTKMLGRALAVSGTGSTLTARTLGQTVGAETHALTIAELAAHTHPQQGDTVVANAGATAQGGGGAGWTLGGTTQSTGSGDAHNNMQPTSFLNAMIKL